VVQYSTQQQSSLSVLYILQHNTLRHIATHCNTATYCHTLQHAARFQPFHNAIQYACMYVYVYLFINIHTYYKCMYVRTNLHKYSQTHTTHTTHTHTHTHKQVMCGAVFYVATVEPFRAAGFTDPMIREQPPHDLKKMCEKLETTRFDTVANGIFLADMLFATHTAFYKPLGSGAWMCVPIFVCLLCVFVVCVCACVCKHAFRHSYWLLATHTGARVR